jgi:hypothetical protein
MRYLNALLSTFLSIVVMSSYGVAQTNERPPSEGQFEPFHKHHDTRFGHDHFYPDRGSIIREVPKEAATVSYAGLSYKFDEGIWYEPRGPAFMVVAPPIGLVVQSLPTFATLLARSGQVYIYCNDVYYRPRPDVNGYEVVNDPAEPTFQVAAESAAATPRAAAAAAPSVAGAPPAALGVAPAIASASPAQPVATPLQETAKVSAPIPVGSTPVAVESTPIAPALAVASASSPVAAPMVAGAVPIPTTVPTTSTPSSGLKVSLSPKQGQSAEQQAHDRYECYRFAVAQSGFDPMRGSNTGSQSDYERAQAACFDGRGYAVR